MISFEQLIYLTIFGTNPTDIQGQAIARLTHLLGAWQVFWSTVRQKTPFEKERRGFFKLGAWARMGYYHGGKNSAPWVKLKVNWGERMNNASYGERRYGFVTKIIRRHFGEQNRTFKPIAKAVCSSAKSSGVEGAGADKVCAAAQSKARERFSLCSWTRIKLKFSFSVGQHGKISAVYSI